MNLDRAAAHSAEQLTPILRALDLDPVLYEGQEYILVRDPLGLSEQALLVPQPLAVALAFMDGTRDSRALANHLAQTYGLPAEVGDIAALVNALDLSLLLQNDRFERAQNRALQAYRKAPFRPSKMAGESYPEDPDELRAELAGYGQGLAVDPHPTPEIRGLVSPHIDYARGGPVYARTWARAAPAIRNADLVILLGTDHYGNEDLITLTRQDYATPLGVLPTDQGAVEELARMLGEQVVFAGELRHLGEHSIELAAVWAQYVREGVPVDFLPILCGSFYRYLAGAGDPDSDPELEGLVASLRMLMKDRKAVIVAAGDLSHVGPAFGSAPVDGARRDTVQAADEQLIRHVMAADSRGFYEALRAVEDRNNVCGLAPIYLALRALAPARGELVAYEMCPADGDQTSLVSICGMLLRGDESDSI